MSLDDSYAKHGISVVPFSIQTLLRAFTAVHDLLAQENHRPVTALGVAAFIIRAHAQITRTTPDEAIELMREFLRLIDAAVADAERGAKSEQS